MTVMIEPFAAAERELAADLYSIFVGADLAGRLPLCNTSPWSQRQWCRVARLAMVRCARDRDDAECPTVAIAWAEDGNTGVVRAPPRRDRSAELDIPKVPGPTGRRLGSDARTDP